MNDEIDKEILRVNVCDCDCPDAVEVEIVHPETYKRVKNDLGQLRVAVTRVRDAQTITDANIAYSQLFELVEEF